MLYQAEVVAEQHLSDAPPPLPPWHPGVVLRVREWGGHHGSVEQQGRELAEDYAFVLAVHA